MVYLLGFVLLLAIVILIVYLCGLAPFKTCFDFLFHHKRSLISSRDKVKLDIDIESLHRIDPGYGRWLVHPCVRYISDGLCGHKWWLVVTPYPNGNSRYEQPILYYGDNNDVVPPKNWLFVGLVQEPHKTGFNSDPNLYYDGKKLWIFWKETKTENTLKECNGHSIMARSYNGVSFGPIQKMADNNNSTVANVFSPTIMEIDGEIVMLATAFEHPRILGNPLPFGHNNLALWTLNQKYLEGGHFVFQGVCKQSYPEDFNFWHADMCHGQNYYCVVTDEKAKRLLVGMSKDGFSYRFNKTELLSSYGNNLSKLYKASMVIVEDMAFVFFPVRTGLLKIRRTSEIYYCSIKTDTLYSLFKDENKEP